MKIKIDECLPQEFSAFLHQKGHNTETVYQEGLQGAPDNEVWRESQKEKRFFITTDLDFSDIRHYKPGEHAGILLIRLAKEGKERISSYFQWMLSQYNIDEWQGYLVVATDHKIRIKMPNET
jgi:predicted nuclease of predicted toxin-antitoxin system